MKIACISFSKDGEKLGDKIGKKLKEEYKIDYYNSKRIKNKISDIIRDNWMEYDGFIFVSAVGIAVRYISSFIEDKTKDPAVVVIDDLGNFVIPILSGHLGGANELAKVIAKNINSTPVITTATDNREIESIDLFAKNNGYYMENMEDIKNVTSIMVDGGKVGFYSEDNIIIDYNNIYIVESLNDLLNLDALIIVSNKQDIDSKIGDNLIRCILRQKNLYIGIGCRKNISGKIILEAINKAFETINRSLKSIKKIGTIELKKDEKGIRDIVKYFGVPLKIFEVEELLEIENNFSKSEFVKKVTGVYSVSEPVAYLLGSNLILEKFIYNGVTISISEGEKYG